MTKRLKKLPKFKNENEERRFWDTHSSVDYFDWPKAQNVIFPNLKPTSTSISLRIPNYVLSRLKERANSLNIPYQTLMKQYIAKEVLRK
ncbi:MAG: BrnA antitoxin family protein [Candidatus Doudnabacteria bacterium]|nr:BrnA antitoxin family protein [Candidatus Doudnabacteria bacterium]